MTTLYEVVDSAPTDPEKPVVISQTVTVVNKQTFTLKGLNERIANREKEILILQLANDADAALIKEIVKATGLKLK